jgi:pyruvate,water dikinase
MKSEGTDQTTLTGVGASSGLARGVARVLHSAGELHRIQAGEILVCEATSPNWTPAFGKIAACVCDGGGTLTHASIISREYRIPCVVGVGLATTVIADGDIVEVDGSKGIVRVTKTAPNPVHA